MFSVVFVRHAVHVGGAYVTITHDALDLTVQGRPSPLPSGHGNSLYTDTDPASADIWWLSHKHLRLAQVGETHPIGMLSFQCQKFGERSHYIHYSFE